MEIQEEIIAKDASFVTTEPTGLNNVSSNSIKLNGSTTQKYIPMVLPNESFNQQNRKINITRDAS